MRTSRLSFRILGGLGGLALGLVCCFGGLEENADGGVDTGALVLQLGADDFASREAASRRLWEIGNAALPALREACRSDDPEVSVRAREIVADLELGILVDTPAETVALLREFHSGGLKTKETVLQRLRGDDQLLTRVWLLMSEKNPEWREKFVREFAGTGDKLMEALRESGQLEEAEEVLAILSPRSWAVHILLEGKAEARVAELTKEWDDGNGSADPSQLCWLLLVTDSLEAAREVADQSGDAGMQCEVYLRQRDWKALMDVAAGEVGTNPVEKLGFKAWFLSKAGDEEGARAVIDELVDLEIDDDRMAENRSTTLLILGRWDLAAQSFGKQGDMNSNEFGFLLERLEFETLAARLGVDPAADGIGAEMRQRIDKALKAEGNDARTVRRELFVLSRSLGDFLVRVGQREEALDVFLAVRELVREDVSYLSYLARTCRSAGFIEEAESMELEVLKIGGKAYSLGSRFPQDRALAELWWDFLKNRHPDDEASETLDRISGILEPPEGGERDGGDPLLAEALKWVEKQGETERAKYYGALADDHQREQDFEAAAEWFRKQSEVSKSPATPLIAAGDMFAAQKMWDQAVPFYAESAKMEPGNELAVYLHGRALVEDGRKEEGEARKAAALRMPLANSNRRNTFASGLLRRGLADLAREQWLFVLRTALHDDWDGTTFWSLRTARLQLVSGITAENPGLAADFLEGYMMSFLKTNSSMTTRSYLNYHARIEALRFEACMAEGDLDGAIKHARRAMMARPGNTAPVIDAAERLTAAGREEVGVELYESLAERYTGAIERFPKSAPFHNTMADLSFRLGAREKAIQLAKRCVELDPDSEVYQSQLERFTAKDVEASEP